MAGQAAAVNPSILEEATLVLNKSWAAIAVTSVRDALCLVAKDHARVICPETYALHTFDTWASLRVTEGQPCIRTPRLELRVPEIVALTLYNGLPIKRVPFTRRNLFRRDKFSCQYCGKRPGSENLTIDHILPRSRGGISTWENCVLACLECNTKKGNRLLQHCRMKLRKPAKEPQWTTLFEIPLGKRRASWEQFVSERYWNTPLLPE